jgi:hypothetical protein
MTSIMKERCRWGLMKKALQSWSGMTTLVAFLLLKKQGLWDKLAISLSCRLKGVSEPKDKGAHDIVKSLFLLSELDMEPKSAPPKIL